jgi:CubicO group peptidase (beta-lactamase class C family)
LLHLALERRFQSPIGDLIDARVLKPLGMANTILPLGDDNGRAQLAPALLERTMQGYSEEGDMARFLAANLGELPIDRALQASMQDAQRGFFR